MTKYHSFINLAKIDKELVYRPGYRDEVLEDTGRSYYIFVEAEDREGNIFDKSDTIKCRVKEMWSGGAL